MTVVSCEIPVIHRDSSCFARLRNLTGLLTAALCVACGEGGDGASPSGAGGSVATASGGTPATASGGQMTSASGGARPSGGNSSGGAVASGGKSANGGNLSGGNASGGSVSVGGSASGGSASGGGPASGGGSSGGNDGSGGTGGQSDACVSGDACAVPAGVTWECQKRFMYGVNYAWQNFAGDFGGITQFSQPGVAGNPEVETTLRTFAQNGVSVVRWWMWPDFRGDGVQTDSNGTATGLGGTALADLEAALALAEKYDLYLMLTIFSFDNFGVDLAENRSLYAIARDPAKRAALVDNVVRPFARAAAESSHADRLIAWDVINEPEWAVTGASLYGGDEAFDPQDDLDALTHTEMETFLSDVIAGLRAESGALITVGGTAMKWKSAWSMLDLDFYQFHMYDWINMYWPYDRSPSEYGVAAKPVVMGEFPPAGLDSGAISYRNLIDSWYADGYAGALAWRDTSGQFTVNFTEVKAFADAHACETKY